MGSLNRCTAEVDLQLLDIENAMRTNFLSRESEMSGYMASQTVFTAILFCGLTTISLANAADVKENTNLQKAAVVTPKVTSSSDKPKVVATDNTGAAKGKEKMGVPDDSIRAPSKR
jgi:hypothetical protein